MKILKDNKQIILAILAFLFAVSLIYRVTHPYKQLKVDTLTYSGVKSEWKDKKMNQEGAGISSAEESLIKLDMFFNPPAHSRSIKRDIFSKEEEKDKPVIMPNQNGTYQTSESNVSSTNNENNIENDLNDFRSFGYMEQDGEKTLFLERGKQIMLIRKGDRIDGKYLVKDITKDELILMVISSNKNIYFDLSDL